MSIDLKVKDIIDSGKYFYTIILIAIKVYIRVIIV